MIKASIGQFIGYLDEREIVGAFRNDSNAPDEVYTQVVTKGGEWFRVDEAFDPKEWASKIERMR